MSFSSKLAFAAAAALSGVDATTIYSAPITPLSGQSLGTPNGCVEISCVAGSGGTTTDCTFSGIIDGMAVAGAGATVNKVHVHDGASCADNGGHWREAGVDPWTTQPTMTTDTLKVGTLSGTATLTDANHAHANLVGKPLILHKTDAADKIGCGMIVAGACPDVQYHAAIVPETGSTNGCVKITCTQPEQVCTFSGDVTGLPSSEDDGAASGKVHVHEDSTCASPGNHWRDTSSGDPWVAGPTITVASGTGTLSTSATLGPGQTLHAMVGKPLIIHSLISGGGKLGCGIVTKGATCPAASPAPAAAPASLAALFLAAAAFF